jgi:hypothetical protein
MDNERFTEEALKAQDGKKVPLTLEIGGPVIGEATLRYDSSSGSLMADMTIENPSFAEFLSKGDFGESAIFKKESPNCPRCGGSGTIPIYPGGGFALNPGNRPERDITCPNCKGTGKKES